mmetsp:Transcript_9395/g.28256  ORF Transcript_9395/g.28256 Transcript_9395/m.28256 type:complete len:91 (+) Transcript_9395:251-523(+)
MQLQLMIEEMTQQLANRGYKWCVELTEVLYVLHGMVTAGLIRAGTRTQHGRGADGAAPYGGSRYRCAAAGTPPAHRWALAAPARSGERPP